MALFRALLFGFHCISGLTALKKHILGLTAFNKGHKELDIALCSFFHS